MHLWCVQSARTHGVRVVPCNCLATIFGATETFSNSTHFYVYIFFLNIIFVMRLMGKWDEEHMAEGLTKPSFSFKKKTFRLKVL